MYCSNNISGLLSPAVIRGFSQFVLAEVRSIWSVVYILGYPPSSGGIRWIVSHTLEIKQPCPSTVCIPVNLQYLASEECCTLHFKTRDGQKSSWIDFSAFTATLINGFCRAHSAPFIFSLFFQAFCDWDYFVAVFLKATFARHNGAPLFWVCDSIKQHLFYSGLIIYFSVFTILICHSTIFLWFYDVHSGCVHGHYKGLASSFSWPSGHKLKVSVVCHCCHSGRAVSFSLQSKLVTVIWAWLPKHATTTVLQTHTKPSASCLVVFKEHLKMYK